MNLFVVTFVLAAAAASFGTIRWETTHGVSVTEHTLLFTNPSTRLVSAPLPLRPLRWYDLAVTMRRGPGTRESFVVVFTDAQGGEQRWQPSWQLPDAARPNWLPLSPARQRYIQSLVVPARTRKVHLELEVARPAALRLVPYTLWELTDLEFVEHADLRPSQRFGPNRLVGGDMEQVGNDGLPAGWAQWGQAASNAVQLVAAGDAAQGRRLLRVHTNALLAAIAVPAPRGSAWRISFQARGRGRVQLLAHSLNDDQPQPLRVGDAQSRDHRIDSATWQRIEQDWFAVAPGIHAAQVVLEIGATTELDVDDVQFQPYERTPR